MSDNKTTKFTPAPWRSNSARDIRNDGGFICFLREVHHYTGQDERYEQELEESKANASLIAQAPAMYEMLEIMLDKINWFGMEATERKIVEILKNARGEKNP